MYGPTWPFLLTYGSHDMRHTGFCRLTVVNETPRDRGITHTLMCVACFVLNMLCDMCDVLDSCHSRYAESIKFIT